MYKLLTANELQDLGFEDVVVFDNYDGCILGVSTNNEAIYSYSAMVKYLMDFDQMTEEDAVDWIEYNTLRSLPYIENKIIVLDDY